MAFAYARFSILTFICLCSFLNMYIAFVVIGLNKKKVQARYTATKLGNVNYEKRFECEIKD